MDQIKILIIGFIIILMSSSVIVGGGAFYYFNKSEPDTGSGSGSGSGSSATTDGTSQISANGCMKNWKYSYDNYNKLDSVNGCTEINSSGKPWCMLPAYVAGGRENVAWKYTNDINDPDCLSNWNYYDASGNVVKNGTNIPRTITWDSGSDNTYRWCPLKTYISQGDSNPLENKSWKYC